MKPLVSVIVPVYNAEKFILQTIESIQNQSYKNFEIIMIDDASTDNSYNTIKDLESKHHNIRVYQNQTNSGVAIARNLGIDMSKGRFIAFLDADDLWLPEKLSKQVDFMMSNNYKFTFTSYIFADSEGDPIKGPVNVPKKMAYRDSLKNHTIWTSTVMLDMEYFSKEDIYMPNVRRGQDTATWWKILKKIDYAFSIDEALSIYRRTNQSLSANKFKAIKRTWNLFRNVEGLGRIESFLAFAGYAYNAVKRRL